MTTEQTTQPLEVLLVDLSSIAYPIWHMNQGDPNPNSTSQKIVEKVRHLAQDHKLVAICKDSGRSFRKDLTDTYKANRPEHDATLQHQIRLACTLLGQRYPVWGVDGFEADDILASAAGAAISRGMVVMVVSEDKDLLQLVDACIRQYRPMKALVYDEARVTEEYGVTPGQMTDYLTLIGDSADNVFGAKGIGPKTATALLQKFGSLVGIYAELRDRPDTFKPAVVKSLEEFLPRVQLVQQLIDLRYDVEIPFDELFEPRAQTTAARAFNINAIDADDDEEPAPAETQPPAVPEPCSSAPNIIGFPARMEAGLEPGTAFEARPTPPVATPPTPAPAPPAAPAPAKADAVALRKPAIDAEVVSVEYTRSLDPRNLREARVMGLEMFNSGLFSAYGSPEGVIATIALGRELGLSMMTSLRSIHIIDNKQSLSAQLMVALVLKSGLAEYFEPVELTDTKCVWETHRKGARNPFKVTHTIEMAQAANLVKPGSGWMKNPQDMLTARTSSRLARMIYPDVVGNLYSPEELYDLREESKLLARTAGAEA